MSDVRHADRLHFIRRCRSMSMSLDKVQTLLDFNDNPERPCGGVNDLVDMHIGQIAQQINELNILQRNCRNCDLAAMYRSRRASAAFCSSWESTVSGSVSSTHQTSK